MPESIQSPSYRHYRPKNLGVVQLDGRDHYLGSYGTPESLVRYHRLIADWLVGKHAPAVLSSSNVADAEAAAVPCETSGLTINDLILAYWQFVESYYVKNGRPTDEQDCIRSALRPLRQLCGLSPAHEFGPLALKEVREDMINRGWTRGVVNKQVGRIRRMFRWGVENELVPVAVHQALQTVAGLRKGRSQAREATPVGPVPNVDVDKTLAYLSPPLQAMVRLQLLTACRPGEICLLRPCDVDMSGEVWCFAPEGHKMEHHNRDRRVYLGP